MHLITDTLLDQTSAEAKKNRRRRMNYNFHRDADDPVHRFLNAIEPESYVPAHRHLNPKKSESVVVLRGKMVLFLFDNTGNITTCQTVDPLQGCYGYEIDPQEWHGLLSLEPGTVIYEIKPGPFVPLSEADRAPWNPAEDDPEAVKNYLVHLQLVYKQSLK